MKRLDPTWRSPLSASVAICLLVVATFSVFAATRCSSCKQRVLQRALVGNDEITVVQRVCGSVGGYQLSIAPPGMDTSGVADRYEPFMVGCDCYDLSTVSTPPVRFTLQPGKVILVEYDGPKMWSIDKQRPTQGKFRLVYKSTLQKRAS